MKNIRGASLFSSAGIAEVFLKDIGIDIKVANELIKKRADLYQYLHPGSEMIQGDITDNTIFSEVLSKIKEHDCKFLIATPPCQGMSTLGKKDYENDERNFLVFKVFEIIDSHDFEYIIIENVPKFLKLFFPYKGKYLTLTEICHDKYFDRYTIEYDVLNAADYGVPQSRPRSIIKMYKKDKKWEWPVKEKQITLREAIGHLPSLESGEDSGIKWHYSKKHNEREILAMKHTDEGCSAMKNEVYFPRTKEGRKVKGFHNTFKRMKWDSPAPARAKNSGNIGGHNNVHPGKALKNGTFSDARVLTLRELFIVSSLPPDIDFPEWSTDNLIRTVIGEAIPPLFCKKIIEKISDQE